MRGFARDIIAKIAHEVIKETPPQTIVKEASHQFSDAEKSSIINEVNISRLNREMEFIRKGRNECIILFDKYSAVAAQIKASLENARKYNAPMTAGMKNAQDRQINDAKNQLDACILKYIGQPHGNVSTASDLNNLFDWAIAKRQSDLSVLIFH